MAVAHFHEHVFVRHTGTPQYCRWWQEWPDAPRRDGTPGLRCPSVRGVDEASLIAALPSLVRAGWDRQAGIIVSITGGMNSTTALIELDDGRFVAKWVRAASAGALDAGSSIALRLASSGLPTGEPLLTARGRLSFATPNGGSLALLRHVPGQPLTGTTEHDQQLMATALDGVHTAEAMPHRSAMFMVDMVELIHDVEPWIRPAVTTVLAEHSRMPPLTWGILHADPAPDAFRYDESTGRVGLIDWTGASHGPVLYDVASALMYLGGRAKATAFWTSYVRASPAPIAELVKHLEAFSRFRAAVQASYFSMRVATSDPTGIQDQRENWKGLRDAQRMLAAHGVTTTAC